MKRALVIQLVIMVFIAVGLYGIAYPEEIKKQESFFLSSLHYTAKGMAYWYDKNNGGIEILTDIPYSKLNCGTCHISSCDECHKAEKDKKLSYSVKAAQNKEICLHCHKRATTIIKIDKEANQLDVHFKKEMHCMDCHTAKEVHGDGTEYTSMRQPGAMEIKCENGDC